MTDRGPDTALSCLHDDIEFHKQEVVELLRHRYSDDQIKELCTRSVAANLEPTKLQNELASEGHPPETYFAAVALRKFMYLEKNIPPEPHYILSAEDTANLILTGFDAILALTEAGVKPAEKHAVTRIKMLKNQPKTRTPDNTPIEMISDELSSYSTQKKHPPNTFDDFLKWLGYKGFEVDRAEQTIYFRGWKSARKFGTVKNWWRDYKNEVPLK